MMQVDCAYCQKQYEIDPRPSTWTGRVRTHLTCPHCKQQYNFKSAKYGSFPNQPRVRVLQPSMFLEEYDCSTEVATRFASQFQAAWDRIPESARQVIQTYWSSDPTCPHVWILNDPTEWGGHGWAGAEPDGRSLYFLAPVIERLPDQHAQLFVGHELAHILLVALGEENHRRRAMNDGSVRLHCERLVWDLMKAWGFNQIAAEEWMERNYDHSTGVACIRETPLAIAHSELTCVRDRQRIEQDLQSLAFPAQFRGYLNPRMVHDG